MNKKDLNEIEITNGGYETFQQCIPIKYRTDVSILVGKYMQKHPSDETIGKIWNTYIEWRELVKAGKIIELEPLEYIKKHYNDN